MSQLRYQEQFAADLTAQWLAGQHTEVRIKIRQMKKAQAAYLAAAIMENLWQAGHDDKAEAFVSYIHPNNQ